ncbi:endonuclease domain-containing protein [Rhodoplanes sp. SY1]|uniref:endonuclease domain-containing protein n=1 Tax=Rhodoplanes sp. SY1 TaxID=3166646 RepID=UPI0038B6672B
MRGASLKKTAIARRLRRDATDVEAKLWQHLRARGLDGHKFVRQEPIGPNVVDFVCREERLIVELDGGQHATDPRDPVREAFLIGRNYCVLRFWNNDVSHNIAGVLETISAALRGGRPLTRSPR